MTNMNRVNFYLEQIVSVEDLDLLQDNVENMFASIIEDLGFAYAYNGLYVDANSPTSLAVRAHPGRCYFGRGIGSQHGVLASVTAIPVNVDQNSASTTVVTSGHQRWLSIWATPVTVNDTPVITPAGPTIQFRTYGGIAFVVTMESEDTPANATKPALGSVNGILLADVKRTYGQTVITAEDIDLSRVASYGQNGQERATIPYLLDTLDNSVERISALEQGLTDLEGDFGDYQTAMTSTIAGINSAISGKAASNHRHDNTTLDGIAWSKVSGFTWHVPDTGLILDDTNNTDDYTITIVSGVLTVTHNS